MFGLSLGSFGGETAFSGEYDLRNRTAGALFAGPPNFNLLCREFTRNFADPARFYRTRAAWRRALKGGGRPQL